MEEQVGTKPDDRAGAGQAGAAMLSPLSCGTQQLVGGVRTPCVH